MWAFIFLLSQLLFNFTLQVPLGDHSCPECAVFGGPEHCTVARYYAEQLGSSRQPFPPRPPPAFYELSTPPQPSGPQKVSNPRKVSSSPQTSSPASTSPGVARKDRIPQSALQMRSAQHEAAIIRASHSSLGATPLAAVSSAASIPSDDKIPPKEAIPYQPSARGRRSYSVFWKNGAPQRVPNMRGGCNNLGGGRNNPTTGGRNNRNEGRRSYTLSMKGGVPHGTTDKLPGNNNPGGKRKSPTGEESSAQPRHYRRKPN